MIFFNYVNKFNVYVGGKRFLLNRSIVIALLFSVLAFIVSEYNFYGISHDYYDYLKYFEYVRLGSIDENFSSRFEVGFSLLTELFVGVQFGSVEIYAGMVFVSAFFKAFTIRRYSSSNFIFAITMTFYISRFFPIDELTQLRASLASAFLLIATMQIWNKQYLYATLFCLAAVSFHNSAIVVVVIVLTSSASLKNLIFTIILGSIAILLGVEKIVAFALSNINSIEYLSKSGFGDQAVNIFAPTILLDLGFIAMGIFNWNSSSVKVKRVIYIQTVGLLIFFMFVGFPVIAHRIRLLINSLWIIYVFEGLNDRKNRFLTLVFVAFCDVLYTYLFVLRSNDPLFY